MVVIGDLELVINHIKKKYIIKKGKLNHYARRACELMESFNSFNISFIPREKNQKVDPLAVVVSLFNPDDSQNQSTFHVKRSFWPSIPDNQEYLQVFENYEHISNFLTNHYSMVSNDLEENQDSLKELADRSVAIFPKDYVSLESLLTREDQKKIFDPKEESSIRKVQETQKINIGTHDSPKYLNLGTSCTTEEIDHYTSLLKEFQDIFGWTYDDLKEYDNSMF